MGDNQFDHSAGKPERRLGEYYRPPDIPRGTGGSIRWIFHAIALFLATALTQIGGLAFVLAQTIRLFRPVEPFLGLFVGLYIGLSLAALYVAPWFGREPLPCFASSETPLASASPMSCVLNRTYVTPDARAMVEALAIAVENEHPGTVTLTLDASFPFSDGFPLWPHLSHDDGEKVDIAFYYRDAGGGYAPGEVRSPLGYWAFEEPREGERRACVGWDGTSNYRWNMEFLQPLIRDDLVLDEARMRTALRWLARQGPRHGVDKVFIEPHLADRFGVSGYDDVIRFQGCRAARHDDHIHLQL